MWYSQTWKLKYLFSSSCAQYWNCSLFIQTMISRCSCKPNKYIQYKEQKFRFFSHVVVMSLLLTIIGTSAELAPEEMRNISEVIFIKCQSLKSSHPISLLMPKILKEAEKKDQEVNLNKYLIKIIRKACVGKVMWTSIILVTISRISKTPLNWVWGISQANRQGLNPHSAMAKGTSWPHISRAEQSNSWPLLKRKVNGEKDRRKVENVKGWTEKVEKAKRRGSIPNLAASQRA